MNAFLSLTGRHAIYEKRRLREMLMMTHVTPAIKPGLSHFIRSFPN